MLIEEYNNPAYSGLYKSRWIDSNSVDGFIHFKDIKVNTEKKQGCLDKFQISAREIKVAGWHASSINTSGPYSYIFLMDGTTGKELSRHAIQRKSRPDVAKAFPDIDGSGTSGFELTIPLSSHLLNKKIKIMSRYAKQKDGNGGVSDLYFSQVKTTLSRFNSGCLDTAQVKGNTLSLKGWHLSNYADNSAKRYLFLIDQTTGKEIKRQMFSSASRPDVGKAFPNQSFAKNSGFDVNMDISNLKNRKVRVLARYSKDTVGNQIIDDFYFEKIITL